MSPTGIKISDKASISPSPNAKQNFYTAGKGFTPVTYTVTAEDSTTASWIVTVKWNLTSKADIISYFSGLSNDPIILPVEIDLADGTYGWTQLLGTIAGQSSNVALDLYACTMSNTEFDPTGGSSGKNQIVSLVLPKDAETITAAGGNPSTFDETNFSSLESVTGNGITTIGNYTFRENTKLKTVSFPEATTVSAEAFYYSTALAEVYLPKVTGIGQSTFRGCNKLKTVDLSSATGTIGPSAFQDCTSLEEISLPNAITIQGSAFEGCTSLATLDLPNATGTIGGSAFLNCTSLTTLDLSSATTIGGSAFNQCTSLATLDLSSATEIETGAFTMTETVPLTITLGAAVPELGTGLFNAAGSKPVTVQVTGNAWDAIISGSPYEETSAPYTDNWGNGFRGLGWSGSACLSGTVNNSVTLAITTK